MQWHSALTRPSAVFGPISQRQAGLIPSFCDARR